MTELEMLMRVVVAALLGAAIGFDREARHKPAGMRTHMLVATGSALAVAASALVIEDLRGTGFAGDPTRVAAGVLTGVGFLGAGAIIIGAERVQGLTTAAGIWVTAAVGITVGYGLFVLSIGATVITMIVVAVLIRIPVPGGDGQPPS